ncbi:MAG TPA: sulfotransferase [Acetobacteraceae bacterium]|jgi:tetratricopeptide (TPR) repeat protein|nr:sulfotransferase [Acetobacteraceae bacterium]
MPDAPETHYNLGIALYELGRYAEATASCRKTIALQPDNAAAHHNLGAAVEGQDRLADAVIQYEHVIRRNANHVGAHIRLGNVLLEQGRFSDAIAYHQHARTRAPDDADIYANLGNTYRTQGHIAAVQQAYQAAIKLAPKYGRYYRSLVTLTRITPDHHTLAAMQVLVQDIASLPRDDQIELHFALGKAYMDLDKPPGDFDHLRKGNALVRDTLTYDESATLRQFDRVRAVFTPELFRDRSEIGDPSPMPIFLIGMPRSGTTLVEQILASHPDVFGAGERSDLSRIAAAMHTSDGVTGFPEIVPILSDAHLRTIAANYLKTIIPLAPTATRITDKMPSNFWFAGLIDLALPRAHVIHVRRNPLDMCLSCFSLLFAGDQPRAYDRAELGRYYRAYAALMEHWRLVLPQDAMLEVNCEDPVTDLDSQARRIVAFCGLDWNDACLDFNMAQRPVRTASAVRVRQPFYRSSVGRWRSYAALLQPLIAELGDDTAT